MSRRAAINTGLSVVGVALLIWQVQDAGGFAAVRRGLASVGVGFVVVLILSFLRFLMRAVAWRALLGAPAPLSAALAATISGDALGNITPFGLAASEPAKAFYLGRHLDPQRAFAALAAENFFYSVSVAVYVIAGVVAMLLTFEELPVELRQGGIAALVLMAGSARGRRVDCLAPAGDGQRRDPPVAVQAGGRTRRPDARPRDADVRIGVTRERAPRSDGARGNRVPRAESRGVLVRALPGHRRCVFARLLLIEALILDSVSRVINVAFKMVPMRLGVDEISSEMVGVAIGLGSGSGLVVALVRKIRMLVWAAVGLALWSRRAER